MQKFILVIAFFVSSLGFTQNTTIAAGEKLIFTASYNTGSFTGSFSGSFYGTASWAQSASQALTASHYQETDPIFVTKSASFATTGSNTFIGNQTITGSIIFINQFFYIKKTDSTCGKLKQPLKVFSLIFLDRMHIKCFYLLCNIKLHQIHLPDIQVFYLLVIFLYQLSQSLYLL